MSLSITSMRQDHLEDAAELVTCRYKALRARIPLMPPRYEQRDTIQGMLRGIAAGNSGVIAVDRGRMLGFMTAFPLDELLGKRCAYSPEWANAADLEDSRRIYEEMYTFLAPRWIEDGCLCHAVSVLANDGEGMEGWHWMGFGRIAVDGVRLPTPLPGVTAKAEVRQATLGDVGEVRELFAGLARHVAGAPTYFIHEMDEPEEWLAKPENVLWLAYQDGEAAGCLGLEAGHKGGCEVMQDEKTVNVEPAYIKEGQRGRGIGATLLNHALERAKEEGYQRCAVDFESGNPLAARFWMRRFEPACFSLVRVIDERVAKRKPDVKIGR